MNLVLFLLLDNKVKHMKKIFLFFILTIGIFSVTSISSCKKGGLNVFSIEDDKNFGLQMEAEIAADPAQFPLVPTNHPSYAYLNALKQDILNSGQVEHANDFVWKLYIVKDDAVQNAFCTPGGYIYVYTGLIK